MSADLGSLPASAAASPLLQLALSGSSESGNSASGTAASPFATLFQQLLGNQAGAGVSATELMANPKELATTGEESDEATGKLDALLPFLEAMGLAQPAPATEIPAAMQAPQISEAALAEIIPTVAPVTPQVNGPAISAEPNQLSPGKTADAAQPLPFASETPAESVVLPMASKPETVQQAAEGQDFGAQLVSAIEGQQKDFQQQPGYVTNTVHQALAQASSRHEVGATVQLPVAQPVGSASWNDAVGNQVVWMANSKESLAELILNPPQMGRVEVSLSVSGDQATASFVSGNPAVRESLEAALPRLREVLAEAGIQLGQAWVGADNAQQSAQQEKNPDNFGKNQNLQAENGGVKTISNTPTSHGSLKLGQGLVDVFA